MLEQDLLFWCWLLLVVSYFFLTNNWGLSQVSTQSEIDSVHQVGNWVVLGCQKLHSSFKMRLVFLILKCHCFKRNSLDGGKKQQRLKLFLLPRESIDVVNCRRRMDVVCSSGQTAA